MRRIYPDYTYGSGPREGCWWDETCIMPRGESELGNHSCDVVVIGAGFTGLNAALGLARSGVSVTVLEANRIGWGASGRNGGFCCLGGAKISDRKLDKRYGTEGRLEFHAAEKAAVQWVEELCAEFELDVDRHSDGETELAHRPKDMKSLEAAARRVEENYGVAPDFTARSDLAARGLSGPFHGAMKTPLGFGMNPAKYLAGLVKAAQDFGVRIFENAPATQVTRDGRQWTVQASDTTITSEHVVIATNGYSSENLPDWMAGRYMPTQSTVIVTRPLSDAELARAGWTSDQMCFDTRNMLHYFRLMPDRRFLFGMRGGLLSGPTADAAAARRVRRDFAKMFPAWADVNITNTWSGMVCLARDRVPHVGPVPDQPGLWAGMCYHGNGVAMGSLSGRILAELILGKQPKVHPRAMQGPLSRFPLGRARRLIMPAAYAGLMLADL